MQSMNYGPFSKSSSPGLAMYRCKTSNQWVGQLVATHRLTVGQLAAPSKKYFFVCLNFLTFPTSKSYPSNLKIEALGRQHSGGCGITIFSNFFLQYVKSLAVAWRLFTNTSRIIRCFLKSIFREKEKD